MDRKTAGRRAIAVGAVFLSLGLIGWLFSPVTIAKGFTYFMWWIAIVGVCVMVYGFSKLD